MRVGRRNYAAALVGGVYARRWTTYLGNVSDRPKIRLRNQAESTKNSRARRSRDYGVNIQPQSREHKKLTNEKMHGRPSVIQHRDPQLCARAAELCRIATLLQY